MKNKFNSLNSAHDRQLDYSQEIASELERANEKHGPFPSVKIGFGRLLCEVVELGVEIFITGDRGKSVKELEQCGAMCKKLWDRMQENK